MVVPLASSRPPYQQAPRGLPSTQLVPAMKPMSQNILNFQLKKSSKKLAKKTVLFQETLVPNTPLASSPMVSPMKPMHCSELKYLIFSASCRKFQSYDCYTKALQNMHCLNLFRLELVIGNWQLAIAKPQSLFSELAATISDRTMWEIWEWRMMERFLAGMMIRIWLNYDPNYDPKCRIMFCINKMQHHLPTCLPAPDCHSVSGGCLEAQFSNLSREKYTV